MARRREKNFYRGFKCISVRRREGGGVSGAEPAKQDKVAQSEDDRRRLR